MTIAGSGSSFNIFSLATVTVASTDYIPIADVSDSNKHKKVLVSSIITPPGGSTTNVQYNDGGAFGGDANYTWNKTTKLLTITQTALAATTTTAKHLINTTAALVGSQTQVSPAMVFEGRAWKSTATAASQAVAARIYNHATAGTTSTITSLRFQSSIAGGAYSSMYEMASGDSTLLTTPLHSITGRAWITYSGGTNAIPGDTAASDALRFIHSSASGNINISARFSTNTIWGINVSSNGDVGYKVAGSSRKHVFYTGSSMSLQNYRVEIYEGGIYNSYNAFNAQYVTAGSADISSPTTFANYGGSASKGLTVLTDYALGNEKYIYAYPDYNSACVGTASVPCSTYNSNQSGCEAHAEAGCTWNPGSSCSDFNYESGMSTCGSTGGCTVETSSCSSANNTDQSTCENQDDSYGGNCAWDTSTCPAITTPSTCSGTTGCSWSAGASNCSDFHGNQGGCESYPEQCSWSDPSCSGYGDQGSCEGAGCYWDGANCLGFCSGNYGGSCSGNLCTGDYNTGGCLGSYGTSCTGTVLCSNINDSSTCAAESGCSWTTALNLTLPNSTSVNRINNTSREYFITYAGNTGPVTIVPSGSDTFFQWGSSLVLRKKGDRVHLHQHNVTLNCVDNFLTEGTCNAQSGCTWQDSCNAYGDQTSCEENSCTWDGGGSFCYGSPSAYCFGTYVASRSWFVHNLERGLYHVQKAANYTLTDIDDVVEYTSGSYTATLPSAVTYYYKEFIIKNSGSGTITIATTSSQTIDGLASSAITLAPGESIKVKSDSANWFIV